MNPSRVTVVGEALVDLLWRTSSGTVRPVPGGSPANVALGLDRLGRPTTFVTTWGEDPPGRLVRDHLAASGLDVRRAPSGTAPTCVALAYLEDNGSATYDFLASWAVEQIPLPADTTLIHTGSLAAVIEPGASRVTELCQDFRAGSGHGVVVDLNVRPSVLSDRVAYRAACLHMAQTADVVKASDEDLAWLFPYLSPGDAARLLLSEGPRLVVVTRGSEGAFAMTADQEAWVSAPQVTVVDTVGAGDAFQAALLDGLATHAEEVTVPAPDGLHPLPTSGSALKSLLTRCTTAAALACTRYGADPPHRTELEEALNNHAGS